MHLFKTLYLRNRLFLLLAADITVFLLAFIFPPLILWGKLLFFVISLLLLTDVISLYRIPDGITARRNLAERFSNGDINEVTIPIVNHYPFNVQLRIIDEIPEQFQKRDFTINRTVPAGSSTMVQYSLRPVKRGEYHFGQIRVFATGILGLCSRRFSFGPAHMVQVFPSFMQMKKYDLLSISAHQQTSGIKRTRKIGHNMEFDQIREYIRGDDVRSLNWKATARRGNFMVNQYQDEKSQQVFCLIDKGRTMKMPFEGMSLLDYSINASLVISNIALKKEDKVGLITYNRKIAALIPADKKTGQLNRILQTLYNEKTAFSETNHETLYQTIKSKIPNRSLLFLFTNFDSLNSFHRQLPFLRKIAANHLLTVIFFENTEVKSLFSRPTDTLEEIYEQMAAEKFLYEKRMIANELARHGILSILTPPQNLTINLINKYLEIKARSLL